MSLLLSKPNLANLGVDQQANDSGLFPQLFQVSLNALATISILLAVVTESLLLALVPAVCHVTKKLLLDMLPVADSFAALQMTCDGARAQAMFNTRYALKEEKEKEQSATDSAEDKGDAKCISNAGPMWKQAGLQNFCCACMPQDCGFTRRCDCVSAAFQCCSPALVELPL